MLKDKVVVITGGAGLLGKEFIKAVVQNQGIGVIADFKEKFGTDVQNQLKKELKSEKIDFFKTDITRKGSIEKLIFYLNAKYGRIDALVNNAYPKNNNFGKHFFEVDYIDFCDNISLNLGGYFLISQLFSGYFKNQGNGNIVNISSIYGVIPPRFQIYEGTDMTMPVEYAIIKSGLIHLTKYMAKYLKNSNIRVNAISPGGILDKQPKSFLDSYKNYCLNKGMLDKTDLQGTLIYLLSDMSKYVNGQNIIVDDGFTL